MTKGSKKQFDDGNSWGKVGESLYKHWVDMYSHRHVDRWLKKHKYNMDSTKTKEFIDYMRDGFINWVNRSK